MWSSFPCSHNSHHTNQQSKPCKFLTNWCSSIPRPIKVSPNRRHLASRTILWTSCEICGPNSGSGEDFIHYLSLSATFCHNQSLSATIRHYQSLSVTIRHYQSLSVTTSHYLPLSVTIRHYPSLSATICYY